MRAFRDLARTPDPTGSRLLLDGAHLVRDARAAGLEFEAVVISASRGHQTEEGALARDLQADGTRVLTSTAQAFGAMSPVRAPSGIVAIALRAPVPPDRICAGEDTFTLIAIDVQDPGNLGALIRSAEAGGCSGVLVCGTSANPFSWKAVRGSMGSALRLPVASGLDVDAALNSISRAGGRVVAAVPQGGDAPDSLEWRGRVALAIGGEGSGLHAEVLARAGALVTIPMTPPVESLNVAVAAAILVYAARQQRALSESARSQGGGRRR